MNKQMNESNERDWLDEILDGHNDYINDGGFTGRVMGRLPARRQGNRLNILIFGCAALLSMAFLLLSAPALGALYGDFIDFLYAQSLLNLAALTITLCAAASALTYWIINPDI